MDVSVWSRVSFTIKKLKIRLCHYQLSYIESTIVFLKQTRWYHIYSLPSTILLVAAPTFRNQAYEVVLRMRDIINGTVYVVLLPLLSTAFHRQ